MSTTTRTTPASVAYALRWPALFVILAAEVMDLLDALVTTIAGPSIRRDLGGGDTLIQWLGAGYTLAMAIGLLTGGRLGDIYGRRRMFMIGTAGFTLELAGLRAGPVAGADHRPRVLQGLVGAVMLPQGLGMIKEMFPPTSSPRRSARSARSWASPPWAGRSWPAGWSSATYFGSGWRMIFLINLPIGVFARWSAPCGSCPVTTARRRASTSRAPLLAAGRDGRC